MTMTYAQEVELLRSEKAGLQEVNDSLTAQLNRTEKELHDTDAQFVELRKENERLKNLVDEHRARVHEVAHQFVEIFPVEHYHGKFNMFDTLGDAMLATIKRQAEVIEAAIKEVEAREDLLDWTDEFKTLWEAVEPFRKEALAKLEEK